MTRPSSCKIYSSLSPSPNVSKSRPRLADPLLSSVFLLLPPVGRPPIVFSAMGSGLVRLLDVASVEFMKRGKTELMSGRMVGTEAVVMAEPSSAMVQVAMSVTSQVGSCV